MDASTRPSNPIHPAFGSPRADTPPAVAAASAPFFLIGVDGGGTGTRARVQDRAGHTLGAGTAGPSGLSQGIEQAWRHVQQAVAAAFASAGIGVPPPAQCGLALALAGAERSSNREAFLAANPGYANCLLENDAFGALRGAFGGAPGRVVVAGTGSVGTALWPDGQLRLIGGWGFPMGDEGSGAWMGVRAVQHAQAAYDGRVAAGPLARAVWQRCGQTPSALLDWSLGSGQAAYATLAPLVFDLAGSDLHAAALVQAAADELARLAEALQPPGSSLPLVVYGSVGARLQPLLPAALREQCRPALGDAVDGALQRLRQAWALSPVGAVTS